ncbi:hypothetical protein BOX15_Mlig005101g1 [Macrostomum lignano]|uniref:RNase_PH domain-containing protein n=2 Tax=Macrostomum lignano TaxID=282301 RepID=A0A1I8IEZ7_9PLAT|nr:hypothetical protein BOX15_Mlig005101g1 [Macrostomum lignano]
MRSAQLGLVQSASGSCLYRSDGTASLAYINGPVGLGSGGGAGGARFRATPGQADLRLSLISAGGSGASARSLKCVESLVLDCLKRCLILTDYPNTAICVIVALIETPPPVAAGGSGSAEVAAAAVLNSCALAMLDAGLSMQRVPLAVTVGGSGVDGGLLVGDNTCNDRGGRRLLACWGAPPPDPQLLADGGSVAVQLQTLEDFIRRVCRRRLKRPGCGGQ